MGTSTNATPSTIAGLALTRRGFLGSIAAAGLGLTLTACGGSSSGSDSASSDAAEDSAADASSYTLVKEGTLICVTDMAFPPFDYLDDNNEPAGYEVEYMYAIGDYLGLAVEYLPPTKFDTIIPLVKQGGTVDCGPSCFTITDERKQEIDFTDPYLDSNQGVAVLKSAGVTSADDLNVEGKTIAVQSGTTGEMWAQENLPNATVVPLDDPVQAMAGMGSGLYDAVSADLPVMQYMCETAYTDCEVALEIPTGEQYGIVVSKDNPGLTAALNEAIASLAADGTTAALQEKWFGTTL